MEFKTTLEIVTKDIQDIEKLVSNFKNYSRIPNIELDLALSRLRNVYDLLLMFRDDSAGGLHNPVVAPIAEKSEHFSNPLPAEDIYQEPVPVISAEQEIIRAAEIIAPVQNEITIPNPEPHPQPQPQPQPNPQPQPKEAKVFINEKLAETAVKKDVASRIQSQGIKSIAGSLGINDKFFFIRELFAGNAETFRQTMAELDDAKNFNDAYTILTSKFTWDMDSEPVQTLLNLIRRKFITSGNE